MPKRTPPKILAARNAEYSTYVDCPKCKRRLNQNGLSNEPTLCARCNMLIYNTRGFNVGTANGPKPTLQDIRDFLHPPEPDRSKRTKGFMPKDLPLGTASERMIRDHEAMIRDHEAMIEDIAHGRPIVVGDDTAITRVADGVVFAAPLPTSKPSGKLAKYEPRPLAHERKASPWFWRTVYAVITMTAAAFTLWQALRVG